MTTRFVIRSCCISTLFLAAAGALLADPLTFDPFAPGTTAYNVGDPLNGQTNAAGRAWFAAGPAGATNSIAAGNLTVTGLAAPTGNSVSIGASIGPSSRLTLSSNFTSGTVYYSMAFRVDDIGVLTNGAAGGFFAGFNNSTGTQAGTPSQVGASTVLRSNTAANTFTMGVKGGSGGTLLDTNIHNVGETIFVVASYTINAIGPIFTNDTAAMWINPSPATFGAASAPTPTLSTVSGGDLSGTNTAASIHSLVLFRRGTLTLEPAAITVDELRVSTNWADVTPPGVASSPRLSVALSAPNVVLTWPTNSTGFHLQGTPSLISGSNAWTNVTASTNTVGTNFSVSDTLGTSKNFYRLINP